MVYFSCVVWFQTRGWQAPGKSFPKKSKPETQNFMQIAEEFKAGTRHLQDAAKLAEEQAVTQTQQAVTQRMWSQQLSVVTKHCWCNWSSGNKYDDWNRVSNRVICCCWEWILQWWPIGRKSQSASPRIYYVLSRRILDHIWNKWSSWLRLDITGLS